MDYIKTAHKKYKISLKKQNYRFKIQKRPTGEKYRSPTNKVIKWI